MTTKAEIKHHIKKIIGEEGRFDLNDWPDENDRVIKNIIKKSRYGSDVFNVVIEERYCELEIQTETGSQTVSGEFWCVVGTDYVNEHKTLEGAVEELFGHFTSKQWDRII